MEFAHNTRAHSTMGHSPFQVWYGYQPEFIPPVNFATTIPTVEEWLCTMNQVHNEVTAALKVAAEVMKCTRPNTPSHMFKEGELVWLEGTNIRTTHPKVKLAARRHGPFKVLHSTSTNTKLSLQKMWRIHPVFHNSLITPYKETPTHGFNFPRPPLEIVDNEDEHYEVDTILQSQLLPNCRGIQYLVRGKGYPNSENSWLPHTQMKHATTLVKEFHEQQPTAPQPSKIQVLQEQQKHKEGMLLRTVTTKGELPHIPTITRDSTPKGGKPIRFYTPWVHAQHPVVVQVLTNQRNGNHQIQLNMDRWRSIKGAGEVHLTHAFIKKGSLAHFGFRMKVSHGW